MLRVEVLETMMYGCITWSPRACHYNTLRRAQHSFLTRCIGRENSPTDDSIFYLNTFAKTGSESIEVVMRRWRISFPRFMAHMKDTRLKKYMMFRELMGGGHGLRGCAGKMVKGVFPGRP